MLIIQGGRVVDPSTNVDAEADLVIDRGKIERVGKGAAAGLKGEKVRVIDAKGLWVLPGLVDLHAHFREPGQEHKEDIASGLRAAAAGGFTTVCAMPNTKPVNDSRSLTEAMVSRAKTAGGARLLPFGAITRELAGKELTEMADLREGGAIGVSDDGKCVMNSSIMRRAMEYAATFDLIVSQHCEDHHLTEGAQMHEGAVSTRLGLRGWPREAEEIIVARDLLLAARTKCRYHVAHVSSAGSIRLLREAKSRGLRVSAEVTPHHLTLTDADVVPYNTACKVNPPLRGDEDRAALREALADGTIDCVATDHAPHEENAKDCEFDAAAVGIGGIETAVSIILELVTAKTLSPKRFAEVLSTRPAALLPDFEGGTLKVGTRADVTLIDPKAKWTVSRESLRSKSTNSPWLGRELTGRVRATIVGGQVIHETEA